MVSGLDHLRIKWSWGLFLERPGNLTGTKSYCVIFKTFETPVWNGKQNSLTGPVITGSFGKRAPGSSPGRGHCVVFLGKTLNSHSASLHKGV